MRVLLARSALAVALSAFAGEASAEPPRALAFQVILVGGQKDAAVPTEFRDRVSRIIEKLGRRPVALQEVRWGEQILRDGAKLEPAQDLLTVWLQVEIYYMDEASTRLRASCLPFALQLEPYEDGNRRPQAAPYRVVDVFEAGDCPEPAACLAQALKAALPGIEQELSKMLGWIDAVREAERRLSASPLKHSAEEAEKNMNRLRELTEHLTSR